MSPDAQYIKTGPDALGTAENDSKSAQHENGSRRPRYLPKSSLGAQNIKTRPDALGIPENESGSAKHESGTRRHRCRGKGLREPKT
jgi:hypothetical protein